MTLPLWTRNSMLIPYSNDSITNGKKYMLAINAREQKNTHTHIQKPAYNKRKTIDNSSRRNYAIFPLPTQSNQNIRAEQQRKNEIESLAIFYLVRVRPLNDNCRKRQQASKRIEIDMKEEQKNRTKNDGSKFVWCIKTMYGIMQDENVNIWYRMCLLYWGLCGWKTVHEHTKSKRINNDNKKS